MAELRFSILLLQSDSLEKMMKGIALLKEYTDG
jgi:hypothetical protein